MATTLDHAALLPSPVGSPAVCLTSPLTKPKGAAWGRPAGSSHSGENCGGCRIWQHSHLHDFTRVLLRYPPVWMDVPQSRLVSTRNRTMLKAKRQLFIYSKAHSYQISFPLSSSYFVWKGKLLIEHQTRALELEMPQAKRDWLVHSTAISQMPAMCQALFCILQKRPKSHSACCLWLWIFLVWFSDLSILLSG